MKNILKRRVISKQECLNDLKITINTLFNAFKEATELYNKESLLTPIESRMRGYETSLLNSKMAQCIQKHLPHNWRFGKYKRFIINIDGYNILFKKLNKYGMPMNIRTFLSDAINNQMQYSLFNEYEEMTAPIVYFGYQKNRFGEIINPQLVYIDEDRVKWTINEYDISKSSPIVTLNDESPLVKVKRDSQEEKKAN